MTFSLNTYPDIFPDLRHPVVRFAAALDSWRHDDNHAYLQTVGRGQEFVLDLAHYPEAVEWLSDLVSSLGSGTRV